MRCFVHEKRYLIASEVFILLNPPGHVSDLMLFSPQPFHKTYELIILASGCGPKTKSFPLALEDIKHHVEESMED